MTLGGSAMYASVMILEPAALEFRVGRGVSSLIYAMFQIGFAFGGLAMGRFADRVGIMIPSIIGSLALATGFFIAAYGTSIGQIGIVMAFFCGFLGTSFSFAPLVADISHWFTRNRGLAIGLVFSGAYVGGAIWPPILQYYFDIQGWRDPFKDLSLFTVCTMLPLTIVFLVRTPKSGTATTLENAIVDRPLGMKPRQLQGLICAAGFGCCVAMAMPQIHIVPYVMDLGHPAIRGAEMLGLMLGFGIFSRIGSGWLSDRIGGLPTLLVGSFLQVSVLTAFLTGDSLNFLYTLSILFGLSQGGIVPSYTMILRRFFPAGEAGWRISMSFLFTLAGMAFGGWIAGVLYDLTGSYMAAFVNAIVFNIANLLIAINLIRQDRNLLSKERRAA